MWQNDDILGEVQAARDVLYNDLVRRWITEIDPKYKRFLAIATQFHPYFKNFSFADSYSFVPNAEADKRWAIAEFKSEWNLWKPRGTSTAQGGVPEAKKPKAGGSALSLLLLGGEESTSKDLAAGHYTNEIAHHTNEVAHHTNEVAHHTNEVARHSLAILTY